MRRWVDFLVLAPVDVEIDALRQEFGVSNDPVPWNGAKHYGLDLINSEGREIHVRIVQLPYQGVLDAAVFTCRLILEWQPWCVVSFGIAGGFVDRGDIRLRDVLVPEVIFYYEPAKETRTTEDESLRQSRTWPFSVDTTIRRKCIDIGLELEAAGAFKLRTGPLASGEKLISDWDAPTRVALDQMNDKILGVEMEAAGVAAAVSMCDTAVASKLLVIKGISDDAGVGKRGRTDEEKQLDKSNRKTAAENAAKLLRDTIHRLRPGYEHLDPLSSSSEALASLFCQAIPNSLAAPIDRMLSRRIAKDPLNLPPAYYQWRIRHEFVHWVDFCYLLVLRQLRECGIPAVIQVTDTSDETTNDARKATEAVAKAVVGEDAYVVFYSAMKRQLDTYVGYAAAQKFYAAINTAIGEMKNRRYVQDSNDEVMNWLYYMAWSARPAGRCVVLAWKEHDEIYKQLMNDLSLQCFVIPRHTLCIGGKLGKAEEPGRSLVIDPPDYASIAKWLKTLPPLEEIRELGHFLTLGKDTQPTDSEIQEFLERHQQWSEVLLGSDTERTLRIRVLVGAMSTWNQSFFRDWASPLGIDATDKSVSRETLDTR